MTRPIVSLLALAAALALLVGCGGSPGAEASGETRTLTDAFGSVEVPATPERVVAADDIALGNMLALGVRPVAASVNLLSVPDFLGDLEGIEDISTNDELNVNLERLAALEPDLILSIGVDFGREKCETLREVAPTYCYRYGYATSDEIRTNMLDLGQALGMEEAAEAEVAELDARVAELRARIAAAGLDDEPVSVLRLGPDFFSIRHGSTESVLMDELGMTRPPNQRSIEDFATDLSLERLEAIDGHALYVYVDTEGEGELEQLRTNPLWEGLDVVQNDRVFLVESGVWNGISLPAAHAILDDIERTLLE